MELKEVFKANDIRGVYGKILDDSLVYKIGRAVVKFLGCKEIIVGRDMRLSSSHLFKSLVKGLTESGADVFNIGLVDTPLIYFASGFYKKPGVMITASHNPADYNGVKIVKAGAKPIDSHAGFDKIREIIEKEDFIILGRKGRVLKKDIFDNYKKYIFSFIDRKKIEQVRIVIDAGNGMAGKIVPLIYNEFRIQIAPLYFKLDGRFPNHVPNPIIKKNVKVLSERVIKKRADFGIAFDGDMDRVVFIDEKGKFINPSFLGALLAKYLLNKNKGPQRAIIYSSAASRIIRDITLNYKGKPLREKVGHVFIKSRMRKTDALFGMEHSGHYYYRDNYYADSGLITSLLVLEIYSMAKNNGKKFSDLFKEFNKYAQAREVSLKLRDGKHILERIERYYLRKNGLRKVDYFDGLWIEFDDYWFSVRKSNTEPLLRINLEAKNKIIMRKKLKEILGVVRKID